MVAIEDFCSDPRIVAEMQRQDPKLQPMGQPKCDASKVAFRRDGETIDIPVAQVFRGFAQSYDMIWGVSDSIIRLPEDRLVNLGPHAPVPFTEILKSHLARVLDMRLGAAVPQYYQFESFYSAFLESTDSGYCRFYEMKPPFAGQLSLCSRMEKFSGEVSYAPGATTWQEAKEIACGFSESGCSIYSMSLAANAQGRATYVVLLRVGHRCHFYDIDAMSGTPSRRGQDRSCASPPSLEEVLEAI
jgi:hypothetical protein